MPYMYILECSDGSYYTGSTWNLELRLWQHEQGLGANHTAKRLPVKLIYCEQTDRIDDAFYREKQVQGWSRKKKQALVAGDTNALHELALCNNVTSHIQAGFGSAQPAGSRSLSEVEGSKAEGSNNEASGISLPERSRRERSRREQQRSQRDLAP